MRLKRIETFEAGPLGTTTISFADDWRGSVHETILLSGANGSGKSTVFRLIAQMWEAIGIWLDTRKILPKNSSVRNYLQGFGGIALEFTDIPFIAEPIWFFFGDQSWIEKLDIIMKPGIGEIVLRSGDRVNPKRSLFMESDHWQNAWANARQQMILSFVDAKIPNLIHLDAEERRWVRPSEGIGDVVPESSKDRWLVRYLAQKSWKGQLEQSLLALKITNNAHFGRIIDEMNRFLVGKSISKTLKTGENRIRVKLDDTSVTHTLDELSAGEHQVLILLHLLMRWCEQGAIICIDEPDLFLHPSLIHPLLERIEHIAREKNAQLILSSHIESVWERYENHGHRQILGEKK